MSLCRIIIRLEISEEADTLIRLDFRAGTTHSASLNLKLKISVKDFIGDVKVDKLNWAGI